MDYIVGEMEKLLVESVVNVRYIACLSDGATDSWSL